MKTRLLARILGAAMSFGMGTQALSQQHAVESNASGPSAARESGVTEKAPSATHQPPDGEVPSSNGAEPKFIRGFADFAGDQKQIWTSPARLGLSDATWLVPLGGITAGLLVADRQYSGSLPQDPAALRHYQTAANVGVASLVGVGAGLYLWSFPTPNEHWRETGWLAGEAALNSLAAAEAFKYALGRERPDQGDGEGQFFRGGTSFPSEHAAVAWSIAGVIAHEYPGTLPKFFAYSAASAVDYARIRGRQHFPADVFVGSVLGYLAAQSVFSRHHDPEMGGSSWAPTPAFVDSEKTRSPAYMGSPYVPLDSWIYPALERLAALGYVKTAILGLRPWTRLECARLVSEAAEIPSDEDGSAVQQLYDELSRELGNEFRLLDGEQNVRFRVESLYVRTTGIAGKPLTDNQHFGQTILNDYGRPYGEGFNQAAGVSSWAAWGPFVIYSRGEYQSAPSAPALSPAALGFIASADGLPANPPQIAISALNRFRLLDGYVGMNLANWQFTFGQQSLWWGPGDEGAMLVTNNAPPLAHMFRASRVSPFRLPGILGFLGEVRLELFLGRLSGQEFVKDSSGTVTFGHYGRNLDPQPFLDGAKISFKFTPNLEFSLAKTTIYGGPGNPLTPKTLVQSAFGVHVNGAPLGDGRSAWDFTCRIPKLRDWLSVYGDVMEEDEPFPINHLEKAAFQGGLYFAKLPRISRLDLRLEGGSTSPVNFPSCNGCYYHNFQYVNGYANHGEPMGSWLGRAAQGEALRTTYWFSPQKKIALECRHRKVDRQFLPQGGTQNDVALDADFGLASGVRLSGTLQYESWQIPLLASGRQSNVTASFQLGYWPQGRTQ